MTGEAKLEKKTMVYFGGNLRSGNFAKTYATNSSVTETTKDVRLMFFNERIPVVQPDGSTVDHLVCEHMVFMPKDDARALYEAMGCIFDEEKRKKAIEVGTFQEGDIQGGVEKEKQDKEIKKRKRDRVEREKHYA